MNILKNRLVLMSLIFAIGLAVLAAPAVAQTVPDSPPSLIARWNLDDGVSNPATLIAEEPVGGHDGFLISASAEGLPEWLINDGAAGSAGSIQFYRPDGSSLIRVDGSNLTPQRVSIELWFRQQGHPPAYTYLFTRRDALALYVEPWRGLRWGVFGKDGGIWGCSIYQPGEMPADQIDSGWHHSDTCGVERDIWDGQWHRLLMTWDGVTLRTYIDGDEVTSPGALPRSLNRPLELNYDYRNFDTSSGYQYPYPYLYIGGYAPEFPLPGVQLGNYNFGGALDEVKMWNYPLDAMSPPVITSVTGDADPVSLGLPTTVSATFTDAGVNDTHYAEFEWGDGTVSTGTVVLKSIGEWEATATHIYSGAGVYTVSVRITDNTGLSASGVYRYVVVYDPDGGFVTGGGWIDSPPGAYVPDSGITGKANFGFVSRYQRGASVPTGNTDFNFQAGSFRFKSTAYEWLVVSGARAQYKGVGTVNGGGDYAFMLTAIDGQRPGGGGVDKFRIKIWDRTSGGLIYDNKRGDPDDLNSADPQAIGGGSIVIHSQ